ncbi:MAG: hypothetical protein U0939_14875 [Pirellulales bacterium]
MTIGLELVFSRDLTCKFLGAASGGNNLDKLRLGWQVAGQFDFLQARPISSLQDLAQREQVRGKHVGIGAHAGLVVLPDWDAKSTDWEHFASFGELVQAGKGHSEKAKSAPLLAGARLSLSPVAYELAKSYTAVIDSIKAVEAIVRRLPGFEALGEERIQVLRSLGSPEIVVLALPENHSQLQLVDFIFQELRQTSLEELAEAIVQLNGRKDYPFQHRRPLPGHALASLDEFLAFRVDDELKLHWTSPADSRLRLDFHLRTDVGHEYWFKRSPKENVDAACPTLEFAERPTRHYWGRHPLRAPLASLDQWVANWRLLVSGTNERQANFVNCETTISFADDQDRSPAPGIETHARHPAWELDAVCVPDPISASESGSPKDERKIAPIWLEVEEICRQLDLWSHEFLSTSQRDEFLNTVHTFRACFLHQELSSAARDLIPFFRQLSLACHADRRQDWRTYRQSVDIEKFSLEVSTLVSHLYRAVRNRLEHRSNASDPTNPHTLEHGACKLVNAYSAIYWFVSELFARRTSLIDERDAQSSDYCHAGNLAVAVASGSQGQIACREVFRGFRIHYERKVIKRRLSEQSGENAWNARLLLLEVSGNSLFQPDMCLVHCAHEVAEFSDWLVSDRARVLRERLCEWISCYYVAILIKLIDLRENLSQKASDQSQPGLLGRLEDYLGDNLWSMLWKSDEEQQLILSLGPVEFCEQMGIRIRKQLVQLANWNSQSPNSHLPMLASNLIACLTSDETFTEMARDLRDLVRELSADIGMWAFLDHLRSRGYQESRTALERLRDVHHTFSKIIESHLERCRGQVSQDEAQLFLLRWSLQAAAVCGDVDWRADLSAWDQSHGGIADRLARLGCGWSLPQGLQELSTLFPLVLPPKQGDDRQCLTRKLQSVAKNDDALICYLTPPPQLVNLARQSFLFPFPTRKEAAIGEAEKKLWNKFLATWACRVESGGALTDLPRRQIELLFHMWAKSTRLRYVRAFRNRDPVPVNSDSRASS